MGVKNKSGALMFASGIDNTGLIGGQKQAMGIINKLAKGVKATDVFAGVAVSATYAFAKAANEAYKFAVEYQRYMTEVSTISDEVSTNFDKYSDAVLQLSTKGAQAPQELAQALYQVVSAGYDGAKGMQLLEAASRSATAGYVETATAADGITTVLNAWQKDATEATAVTDVFFKTVERGKTTFPELAANIAQVAPIASSLGISFEEVMAAIAALTKQGTPTAIAITQIRSAVTGIAKKFGDAAFEGRNLLETFEYVAEQSGYSIDKLAKNVGRIEGANAILATSGDKSAAAIAELNIMLNDTAGAVDKAVSKVEASTDDIFGRMRNNLIVALAPLGTTIMEEVASLADELNSAFEDGRLDEFFSDFAKALKITAALMIAFNAKVIATNINLFAQEAALRVLIAREAVINRWRSISVATQSAYNASMAAGTGIMGAMATAAKALWTALAANPLTSIVAVVGLAAAAYFAFRKEVEAVNDEMSEAQRTMAKNKEELETELATLENLNPVYHDRQKYLDAFNMKYGTSLKNLKDEEKYLKQIKAVREDIIKQMMVELALETQKEKVGSLLAEINLYENSIRMAEAEIKTFAGQTDSRLIQREKQLRDSMANNEELIKQAQQKIKDIFKKTDEDIGKIIGKGKGGASASGYDIDAEKKKLEEAKEIFDQYKQLTDESSRQWFVQQQPLLREDLTTWEDYLNERYEKAKEHGEKVAIELAASATDIKLDAVKYSNPGFTKLNPITDVTTDKSYIDIIEERIMRLKKQMETELDYLKRKSLADEIEILEEKIRAYNDFSGFMTANYEQLFQNLNTLRNKDLKALRVNVEKQYKLEKDGSAAKIKLAKQLAKIDNEILQNNIDTYRDINYMLSEASALAAMFDDNLADALATLGKMADSVGTIVEGFAKGNLLQVAGGGLGFITQLVGLFQSDPGAEMKTAAEKLSDAADNLVKSIDALREIDELSFDTLLSNIAKLRGLVRDADAAYNDMKATYDAEIKDYYQNNYDPVETKNLDDFTKKIFGMSADEMDAAVNDRVATIEKLQGKLDHVINYWPFSQAKANRIAELQKEIYDVEQELKRLEKYSKGFDIFGDNTGYTKQWNSLVYIDEMIKKYSDFLANEANNPVISDETKKQAQDTLDSLLEMRNAMISSFEEVVGFTTGDLADSITSAFMDGTASAEYFAKKTEDFIREALINSFKSQIVGKQIEALLGGLAEDMSDGVLSDKEADAFVTSYMNIVDETSAAWDQIKEQAERLGVELSDLTGEDNSLAGAIGRALSEDTANYLAGLWNVMTLDVRQITENIQRSINYQQAQLGILANIEDNTKATASNTDRLESIENELIELNDNLSGTASRSGRDTGS